MTIENLEMIFENIENEIEELNKIKATTGTQAQQLQNIKNNLTAYNDDIYKVFEDNQTITAEIDGLQKENQLLKNILSNLICNDYQQQLDIKLQYGLDI